MSIFDPPVYLDYAATTPLHPQVIEEIARFSSSTHGNPSSAHQFGRRSRAAIDQARDSLAQLLRTDSADIFFTSGGTEANNLALMGTVPPSDSNRNRIVVSSIEHHSVLNVARHLASIGFDVQYVPATRDGGIDLDVISALIDESVVLVSVMLVNNETGVILPVRFIADMARESGALMHTDATQAAGLLELDPNELGVDLLSLSAHKFYGPKGTGALWVRRGVKLKPHTRGGAQERELRAGTENLTGIIGMGVAARLAISEQRQWLEAAEAANRAFQLEFSTLSQTVLHGAEQPRLASILHYSIAGVPSELLTMKMDSLGVAISAGAACASGSLEPSHVLAAMGLAADEVDSSIRASFGRCSNPDQVRQAAGLIAQTALQLRDLL